MAALVVTGGEGPDRNPGIPHDRIIAADSGYDLALALGLKPGCVIGDFDSTSRKDELLSLGYVPLRRDKDISDTEAAIASLRGSEYDIYGGGGGRSDHFVGILALFDRYPLFRLWLTKHDLMVGIKGKMTFSLPPESDVSLFPATGKGCIVMTHGLRWELDGAALSHGFISLSNRNVCEEFSVEADNPLIMCMGISLLPYVLKTL